MAKGLTLDKVRRTKPTSDYDGLYGGQRLWSRDLFVDAIYQDVKGRAK